MASGFISFYNLIIKVVLHCPLVYNSLSSAQYWQCQPKRLGHEKQKVKPPSLSAALEWKLTVSLATFTLLLRLIIFPCRLKRPSFSHVNKVQLGYIEVSHIWGPYLFFQCICTPIFLHASIP